MHLEQIGRPICQRYNHAGVDHPEPDSDRHRIQSMCHNLRHRRIIHLQIKRQIFPGIAILPKSTQSWICSSGQQNLVISSSPEQRFKADSAPNSQASVFECPNGSICHVPRGIASSPNSSSRIGGLELFDRPSQRSMVRLRRACTNLH